MRHLLVFFICFLIHPSVLVAAEADDEDIYATTSSGDEIVLHANGYWEYKDAKKAEVAKAKVARFEEEKGCPRGTRPSFLGIGRCIAFDDPILKRGSLSGKGR